MSKKNNWAHLSGCDWSNLLQFQPRFADKCDWSNLDGEDWAMLLRRQPQFATKCDWTKLEGRHWMLLLRVHPEDVILKAMPMNSEYFSSGFAGVFLGKLTR